MTSGIGTRQEEDGSFKFCDGMKSVPVQNENIEKHVPPIFSNEAAELDFEEFMSRFSVENEVEYEDDDEEEQETILGDEFKPKTTNK